MLLSAAGRALFKSVQSAVSVHFKIKHGGRGGTIKGNMKSVRADCVELLICEAVRSGWWGGSEACLAFCSVVSAASHPHGAHSSPFNNVSPLHPCSRRISLSSLPRRRMCCKHYRHKPRRTDALN